MEFIRDNLRLIVTGVDTAQLEELMDQELETHHEEGYAPVKQCKRWRCLPAFGIVASVMGVYIP